MAPLSLRCAAGLVAAECVFLIVVAVLGLIDPTNVGVAVGLGLVYLVCALGLGLAAVGLWERRSWGRAPVVFAQLVVLGVCWDIHHDVLAVAVAGVLLAVCVLGCVFHPASTRALSGQS